MYKLVGNGQTLPFLSLNFHSFPWTPKPYFETVGFCRFSPPPPFVVVKQIKSQWEEVSPLLLHVKTLNYSVILRLTDSMKMTTEHQG